jgi:hypothetical protein
VHAIAVQLRLRNAHRRKRSDDCLLIPEKCTDGFENRVSIKKLDPEGIRRAFEFVTPNREGEPCIGSDARNLSDIYLYETKRV